MADSDQATGSGSGSKAKRKRKSVLDILREGFPTIPVLKRSPDEKSIKKLHGRDSVD